MATEDELLEDRYPKIMDLKIPANFGNCELKVTEANPQQLAVALNLASKELVHFGRIETPLPAKGGNVKVIITDPISGRIEGMIWNRKQLLIMITLIHQTLCRALKFGAIVLPVKGPDDNKGYG